ncbi:MAG: hypothetical protein DI535_31055, partial [Citrobacter freundii]
MAYQRRQYSDAEKAQYYAQRSSNRGSNYSNRSTYSSGQKSKKSGAKLTRYVNSSGEEKYLTTAWRKTKQGFIKIKAITTKDSKLSDKNWFGSVAVTFTNLDTGTVQFHWGTMEKNTGKVVIDSMA